MSESSIHAENNERAFSPETEQTAAGPESAVQNEAAAPLDIKRVASGLGNTQIPSTKIQRQRMGEMHSLATTVGTQLGNSALKRMVGGGKNDAQVKRTAAHPSSGPDGGDLDSKTASEMYSEVTSASGRPVSADIQREAAEHAGVDLSGVQVVHAPNAAKTGRFIAATGFDDRIATGESSLDHQVERHEASHLIEAAHSGGEKGDNGLIKPPSKAMPSSIGGEHSEGENTANKGAAEGFASIAGGSSSAGEITTKRDPSVTRSADLDEGEDVQRTADLNAQSVEGGIQRTAAPQTEDEAVERTAVPEEGKEEEAEPTSVHRTAAPDTDHNHDEDEEHEGLQRTAAPEGELEDEEA